ncbi:NADPH-dependent FMN reductase [Microbacterium gorillae]|uniref:NADPH-dependent FMN reductase n=1 Tax=Microbacterium gorillae TaxID=1231063 RepID=UPI000590AF08|nr:NAD(P)H-dependent oxidoreductase [Microbacterium gorillae]
MTSYRVGVIVGSLSTRSINARVAACIAQLGPDAELDFFDIPIGELPFYRTDFDADYPAEGEALKRAIAEADGVLMVTPEYNRSIPAVLKDAIDWTTRPPRTSVWPGKPVAITGTSGGVISTAVAQEHLRSVMVSRGALVLGDPEMYLRYDPELYAEDGTITNAGTRDFLLGWLRGFRDLIARSEG